MFDVRTDKYERRSSLTQPSSPFVVNHFDQWKRGVHLDTQTVSAHQMPNIIAVGGGKGGVGKSIVSANLSAVLAQSGYRVLVVDMDLGCSNLHSHYGVAMPKKTLADFVLGSKLDFRDVILPAPVQGVAFVAGGRDEQWHGVLDQPRAYLGKLWQELIRSKLNYKVDFVVLDLGAGVHRYTMDFFTASHVGVVTVLPEPTSIENAYVFLKSMLWSLIEAIGVNTGQVGIAEEIQHNLTTMSAASLNQGYAQSLRSMMAAYPEFIQMLAQTIRSRYVGLLVNQTRDQSDLDIGHSMEHICQKYFGLQSRYLGFLNHDQAVLKSLRNRRLLVNDFPHSSVVKRLMIAVSQTLNLLGLQRKG